MWPTFDCFTDIVIAFIFHISVQNECNWLARSSYTEDYDILSVAEGKWSVWTGMVEPFSLTVVCNECWDKSDCNYRSQCLEKRCVCLDDVSSLQ